MNMQIVVDTEVYLFFSAANYRVTSRLTFLIRQHLVINSFNCIFKTICVVEGISGSGFKNLGSDSLITWNPCIFVIYRRAFKHISCSS